MAQKAPGLFRESALELYRKEENSSVIRSRKRQNIDSNTAHESPKRKKSDAMEQNRSTMMRCLSGDVKETRQWIKKENLNVIFEVFGKIVKIGNTVRHGERVMLMRNQDQEGPILQVVYREIDFQLSNVRLGDVVRGVGRCRHNSELQLFKLTKVTTNLRLLQRLGTLSNFALRPQ